MTLAETVGALAALCSMSSFIPQLAKVSAPGAGAGVSRRMYLVTVVGFALWTAYGVMSRSWPVVGSNTVCLILSATILFRLWRGAEKGSAAS